MKVTRIQFLFGPRIVSVNSNVAVRSLRGDDGGFSVDAWDAAQVASTWSRAQAPQAGPDQMFLPVRLRRF